MNKIKSMDLYLKDYGLQPELGDKVIRKNNECFDLPTSSYKPHVAEFIGHFDNGSKVYAVIRAPNESGGFELGYIDPKELFLV